MLRWHHRGPSEQALSVTMAFAPAPRGGLASLVMLACAHLTDLAPAVDNLSHRRALQAAPGASNRTGCTDAASQNYNVSAVHDDGSCLPPGLRCAELSAPQCCEEQRTTIEASGRLGCRAQFIELHNLLYALNCGVGRAGWGPPPAAAMVAVPELAPALPISRCYSVGGFDACEDGTCVPHGHPCSVCAGMLVADFETCEDGTCVPAGAPCAAPVYGECLPPGRTCHGAAPKKEDPCPQTGMFVRCSSYQGTCIPAFMDAELGMLPAPQANSSCCERLRMEAVAACTHNASSVAACSSECDVAVATARAVVPSCGTGATPHGTTFSDEVLALGNVAPPATCTRPETDTEQEFRLCPAFCAEMHSICNYTGMPASIEWLYARAICLGWSERGPVRLAAPGEACTHPTLLDTREGEVGVGIVRSNLTVQADASTIFTAEELRNRLATAANVSLAAVAVQSFEVVVSSQMRLSDESPATFNSTKQVRLFCLCFLVTLWLGQLTTSTC